MVKHVRIIEKTQWQSETKNWNGKLCRFATFTGLIFFFFFFFPLGVKSGPKKKRNRRRTCSTLYVSFLCVQTLVPRCGKLNEAWHRRRRTRRRTGGATRTRQRRHLVIGSAPTTTTTKTKRTKTQEYKQREKDGERKLRAKERERDSIFMRWKIEKSHSKGNWPKAAAGGAGKKEIARAEGGTHK